jgi:hypothetical protein
MKTKFFSIIFVAAIAVAAAWNFSQSKTEVELSNLALANVEALADGEVSVSGCCTNGIACVLTSNGSSMTFLYASPCH